MHRRSFINQSVLIGLTFALHPRLSAGNILETDSLAKSVALKKAMPGEDLFRYMKRVYGGSNRDLLGKLLGAANEFKEGDYLAGLAAADQNSRLIARELIANTIINDFRNLSVYEDQQSLLILKSIAENNELVQKTFGQLKAYLLSSNEAMCKEAAAALTSDEIAVLVKLMSNAELIALSQKVFNPLANSNIGSKGYLGARVQPNSPTDDPEDIFWQVMDAWSYAVGDVVLGTNPVSSDVEQVARIEATLFDIISTFQLENTIPHCVLAHIDIQANVEKRQPGSTGIWFQSIAGTDDANQTFDVTLDKLKQHLEQRKGRYGFYAETGQGADETNGHGHGFDMLIHESRKYGLLRAIKQEYLTDKSSWLFANDVAGFIGPEVFRTKEQLVRCCLEDLVMGKLHGLTLGLDICTTLHMDVTLDDLDWCIDEIMPANPAYLMALPTKNDPMLSYLTTSFSDHLRVRQNHGFKVNDAMWDFFKSMEIVSATGKPTKNFGDPIAVYTKYCRAKGDSRSDEIIRQEGNAAIARVRSRGVPIAEGTGASYWMPPPALDREIRRLYADAKYCLWQEMDEKCIATIPDPILLYTRSVDRVDYVYHPATGEELDDKSVSLLKGHRQSWSNNPPQVQIIISDGLNVRALFDDNHLSPFLKYLESNFTVGKITFSKKHPVIKNGRVRAGYRAGELLFGTSSTNTDHHLVVHIIGERPGSEHRNFSVYITAANASQWNTPGLIDHDRTRVVSGISDTALLPEKAATEVFTICKQLLAG